jgi:hypothetical protein
MELKAVKYSLEINERFFEAFEALVLTGKIRSMSNFCENYGLYRVKYTKLRTKANTPAKSTNYKYVDAAAVGFLIRDYNISSNWIFAGKGSMINLQP